MKTALFDELTALYPDSDAAGGSASRRVSACNGTVAGVQIMLADLTPGIPVSIQVEGPHTAFKLFELIPVPVEVNTGAKQRSAYLHDDVNETVIRKAPFYVYEALKPIYNLILPQGVSAALALKIKVEYCKAARDTDWKIILSQGKDTQTLVFTVAEYPCEVRKSGLDTHKLVNWISYQNVALYHRLEPGSMAYDIMLGKYLRAAAFSRQNMINLPVFECMKFSQDGAALLDEKKLLHYINIARKAGMTYFQCPGICGRASGLADNDEFYDSLDHASLESPDDVAKAFRDEAFDAFDNGTQARVALAHETIPGEAGVRALRLIARRIFEFVEKYNLKDVWYQCCLDEPNDALENTYRIITSIVRQEMPGIKIFEPILPTHAVEGMLDVYCPTNETYENDRAFYDAQVEKGAELFVYTCLTPGGAYMNRMLDFQRLRSVYLGWAPILYPNVTGFLHWGLNQYPAGGDPYARSCVMFSEQVMEFHPKRAMFLPAGDFCVLYPGYSEPYISTRSEAQRIGLEDLELLQRIKDAPAFVRKLVRGYADWTNDVDAYRELREELMKLCS